MCCRKYVEEEYVWKVFHQLLLALEECHKKRAGVHKVSKVEFLFSEHQ